MQTRSQHGQAAPQSDTVTINSAPSALEITAWYHAPTGSVSYVVDTGVGSACAVIDSVLDFDPHAGRITTTQADVMLHFIQQKNLQLEWILETHVHADHLSAAKYLQQKIGGKIGIGEQITQVQKYCSEIFLLEAEFACDGRQFDHLFADREVFQIGALAVEVMHVPGHTPADVAYRIANHVFVGDTLFMPDIGSARCDFPGGNAATLYQSVQKILALPASTNLYLCHDYPHYTDTRTWPEWQTTVAAQKHTNIHLHQHSSQAEFIQMRNRRDATLDMPLLMLPGLQINIRAGALPPLASNGKRYLQLPLNQF